MRELFLIVLIVTFFVADISKFKTQNLILNPGCEDIPVNGSVPSRTGGIGANRTHRVSDNPRSYEGNYIFFTGVCSQAELWQDVYVSSMAAVINRGIHSFYFRGHARSYTQSPPDHSRIILEYPDTLETKRSDSVDLREYLIMDQWFLAADTTIAPIGIKINMARLIHIRYVKSANNGYYAGLSLTSDASVSFSKKPKDLPDKFTLHQNYPNPFNPRGKYKVPFDPNNLSSRRIQRY